MELDTIVVGDCLGVMAEMLDGCVDLVIADMPYKDGQIDGAWGSNISLELMWDQLYRISKINAVFAFFGQPPFSFRLGYSNIEHFRHDWTWIKDRSANYLSASYMPLNVTEQILIFSQCGFAHNSQNKCTYNPKMIRGVRKKPRMKRRSVSQTTRFLRPKREAYKAQKNQYFKNPNWCCPKNFLYFPVPSGIERIHPTQKPLALIKYLIETYSNQGDIVLDFVMGSGTTAVAALKLGRHFYGCDINPEYVKLANERIEKERLEMAQMELFSKAES